jgi:hypothetical protein
MVWIPACRVDSVTAAVPPLRGTGLPLGLPSTTSCTVPVGGVGEEATETMVAVTITGCPRREGLREEVTVVAVPSTVTSWLTLPLLPRKEASPL